MAIHFSRRRIRTRGLGSQPRPAKAEAAALATRFPLIPLPPTFPSPTLFATTSSRVTMYVDLNVPVPQIPTQQIAQPSKKGKGKQTQQPSASAANVAFTPGQLNEVESRVDLLVHCERILDCHRVDVDLDG